MNFIWFWTGLSLGVMIFMTVKRRKEEGTDSMIKFIPLLLFWIFSLYLTSWIHTSLRAESVLINTEKKWNKILFL